MSNNNPQIIITVIGSLNADLITRTTRIPSAGETLIASSFDTGSGGKGANQAVACSRLVRGARRRREQRQHQEQKQLKIGDDDDDSASDQAREEIRVKMVGAVGDDAFGPGLITTLAENGVDVSEVKIQKDQQTGVAVVLVDEKSGENRILLSPKTANRSLTPEDFESLPDPRPDLIIMQLEMPLETVYRVIELAKAAGVPVLLNPSPAPAGGLPKKVYDGLSHLILNETEAEILCRAIEEEEGEDQEEKKEKEKGVEEAKRDPAKAAHKFLELGVENVVITLGSQGAYYASSSSSSGSPSSGTQPIKGPVNVVDTTGAGDTFVGAYAVKICEDGLAGRAGRADRVGGADRTGGADNSTDGGGDHHRLSAAVEWATRAATKSVEKRGAQEGIPWREEVD